MSLFVPIRVDNAMGSVLLATDSVQYCAMDCFYTQYDRKGVISICGPKAPVPRIVCFAAKAACRGAPSFVCRRKKAALLGEGDCGRRGEWRGQRLRVCDTGELCVCVC